MLPRLLIPCGCIVLFLGGSIECHGFTPSPHGLRRRSPTLSHTAWRGRHVITTRSDNDKNEASRPLRASLKLLKKRGGGIPLSASLHLNPTVVKASFSAVAELLVCCGIGAAATRKGVLDSVVIGSLSKVVYNILLPSLLVVNVARTVYSNPLLSLLPLPAFAVMQIVLCSGLSRIANWVLGLDPNGLKGRELAVCSTFGNSGVLPILFATVLLRNHPDPNALPLAISYISFYLLGWSPIFWTKGFSKLAGPALVDSKPVIEESSLPPNTNLGQRLKHLINHPPAAVTRILSPPILGSVGGLLLGISPLARFFLSKDAPLGIITNAVDTLAKAYSPAALLVLAGSLALPIPPVKVGAVKEKTISAPVQVLTIGLIRFVLCPTLFLSIIFGAMSRGLVQLDKLMVFVLFLQSSMPSAQNTIIIHSLMGRQEESTKLARLLLWIYVSSCIPISLLLTFYLGKVGL